MAKRLEFRYGRTYFLTRALVLVLLFAVLLALLAWTTPTSPFWLALLAAAAVVYLVVVGVSPLSTTHWLTRSRLILRQGWYFRAVLPLRDLASYRSYEGRGRYGLRASGGVLFVVGALEGLVAVELRRSRRFPHVLFASAREIVFDVEDREGFLRSLGERLASLPPVQADGADAHLRD